jgi:gluconolactonase
LAAGLHGLADNASATCLSLGGNSRSDFYGVADGILFKFFPAMITILQTILRTFAGTVILGSAAAVLADSVVEPGAKLEKLAGDFAFTEGPTRDAAGNVFFVDQPNDRIMEWSVDGKLSTFLQPSGYANGMCFDAQGNLIACADEHNQLWSITPDKHITVLITNYQGKYLNGPNDVWVAPNGGMFITDPFYKRTWWDHTTMALTNQEVFYLTPDRKTLTMVTDDLKQPNGITGSPDGKNLFVSDISARQTWRYDIQPDGTLANKTFICAQGSDGMTIDAKGNLYLTGRGITVYDPSGKKIDHIDVPEGWTANLCFSGPDRRTLFITASKSFYSIRLLIPGANPAK